MRNDYQKEYYQKNKARIRQKQKANYEKTKEEKAKVYRERYHTDPDFRAKKNAINRASYRKNQNARLEYSKDYHLRRKYSLSLEQKLNMLKHQGEVCAICGTIEPTTLSGWHVDHDHTSGNVRGILCHHCNAMLGYAKENVKTLSSAITYLEKFSCQEATS